MVRIEEARTLYHAGFADDGRPMWGDERHALEHQDAGAAKAMLERVSAFPWMRPGDFGVQKGRRTSLRAGVVV